MVIGSFVSIEWWARIACNAPSCGLRSPGSSVVSSTNAKRPFNEAATSSALRGSAPWAPTPSTSQQISFLATRRRLMPVMLDQAPCTNRSRDAHVLGQSLRLDEEIGSRQVPSRSNERFRPRGRPFVQRSQTTPSPSPSRALGTISFGNPLPPPTLPCTLDSPASTASSHDP